MKHAPVRYKYIVHLATSDKGFPNKKEKKNDQFNPYWALSRNLVKLGFLKHGYHARDSKTSKHNLFRPAKGSSVGCVDLVKSLGN